MGTRHQWRDLQAAEIENNRQVTVNPTGMLAELIILAFAPLCTIALVTLAVF